MTFKTYLNAVSSQSYPNIKSVEEFPPLSSASIAAHQAKKADRVATKTLPPTSPVEPREFPSLFEAYKMENL